MIRIHYLYKNNPKFDNKEIRGLQTQKRHQIFLSNAFLLVIRLGLEPKTPTLKEVAAPKRQKASPMARFLTQPAKLANLAFFFKELLKENQTPQFNSRFNFELKQSF